MSLSRLIVKRLPGTALVAVAALAGCHHDPKQVSDGKEGPLKVEAVSTKDVELSEPTVETTSNMITVAGTVRRKDGAPADLGGRVDIDVLGSDRLPLYQYWTGGIDPRTIPTGAVGSHYAANLGIVPPAGAIIRVRFVDRQQARSEDLTNRDPNYTGSGGHVDEGRDNSHSIQAGQTGAKSY